MGNAGPVLGFSRAAHAGVSPPPVAAGLVTPERTSGRFHLLSTPDEEVELPGVPLLGTGDLCALEPQERSGAEGDNRSDEEKEVERRCQKVVDHHRAVKQELQHACREACKLQEAVWVDSLAARREGRRPNRQLQRQYLDATAKTDALKIEKRVFQEHLSKANRGSGFQGHP